MCNVIGAYNLTLFGIGVCSRSLFAEAGERVRQAIWNAVK